MGRTGRTKWFGVVWAATWFIASASAASEDAQLFTSLVVDQLEYRSEEGVDRLRWDIEGWAGGDTNRVWLRTEGENAAAGADGGDLEVQLYYGRHVAPYWDLLIGVRQDVVFGSGRNRDRTFAVVSLEGLSPYRFELEPSLFVSDSGDLSARFTATTDWFLTQRLVAQPRFEINVAASGARGFGVRSGVNDVELGLRLRYEIRREAAPYVGVSWVRRVGDTADLARSRGEGESDLAFVAGMRFWF
jgi:copper resistance protein B